MNAFQNSYWPRKYLVDSEGYIRYDHIGEGVYAETENAIRGLLAEKSNGKDLGASNLNQTKLIVPGAQTVDFNQIKTPELYFGYQYMGAQLGKIQGFSPEKIVNYTMSGSKLDPNVNYLQGPWKNNPDSMELIGSNGKIKLTYSAKSINIVAAGKGQAYVKEDCKYNDTSNTFKGNDVDSGGKLSIDGQRLYNIADHKNNGSHQIEIDARTSGFRIHTFTFV